MVQDANCEPLQTRGKTSQVAKDKQQHNTTMKQTNKNKQTVVLSDRERATINKKHFKKKNGVFERIDKIGNFSFDRLGKREDCN